MTSIPTAGPDLPGFGRRSPRLGLFFAVAVMAPLIGLAVGVLVARPALRSPFGLRSHISEIDPAAGLRGQQVDGLVGVDVAAPFVLAASKTDRQRATRCLADAIYYEAALEPIEGRRAVAQVVLNRVRDPNFPKSICGVVYDGWRNPPACQFSFACDGSMARAPIPGLYRQALGVAEQALAGRVEPAVGLATHYHATTVDPWWRASLVRVTQIGSQVFYRWPGEAGRPGAFTGRYAGGEQAPTLAELTAPPALALQPPPAPSPRMAGGQAGYLLGRPVRSREDVRRMNRWLEEHQPQPGSGSDAAS